MSFVTLAALLAVVLVAAPIAAHMLRRKQADERIFTAVRLVPPTPPAARKRSALEDRALFGVRALSVLLLAALGATPFIHCSRLALSRKSGASVALAIVIDDSLSMRATVDGRVGGATRFARALDGARELVAGLRGGDAVAVVLAGAPARVALASTTDMAAASATFANLAPSDRATDLDGAVALARGLVRGLAQPDKRVVVLSDLADGAPDGPALSGEGDVTLWAPLTELAAPLADCAVTRADRAGTRVRARVVCTPPIDGVESPSRGRTIEVLAGDKVLAKEALADAVRATDYAFDVPQDAPERLRVALTGADAIAEDDEAPALATGGALPVAIVVDASTSRVATGGPPPIEQALSALELDAQVHPLPAVPERADDLAPFAALVVDDAPGFTPEVRRALAAWVEKGGVALVTLGPRAAAAPLGAGFDPLVPGVVRWGPSPVDGADPSTASLLGVSAEGFAALAPKGRASVDPSALEGADVLARWKDGAPLWFRRSSGRGAVLVLTLPLSADESDLVLRPAFLSLLERFVGTARSRGGARRVDVGETWTFDGYAEVKIARVPMSGKSPPEPVVVDASRTTGSTPNKEEARLFAQPPRVGLYELELDGEHTTRVASVAEREIDLRPRKVEDAARAASLGGVASAIDASPFVALALLGLLAAELVVRAWTTRTDERAARAG